MIIKLNSNINNISGKDFCYSYAVYLLLFLYIYSSCSSSKKNKPKSTINKKIVIKKELKPWLPKPADFEISKNVKKIKILKNGKKVKIICRGDKHFKEVALTFDIGDFSGAEYVLNLLKKEKVKATMFLANNRYSRKKNKKTHKYYDTLYYDKDFQVFKNLVKRMRDEGHLIGNHTWGHHHLVKGKDVSENHKINVTKEFFLDQLERVEKQVYNMTGTKIDPLWRAPFGEVSMQQIIWAQERGYVYFQWTIVLDSMDWMNKKSNAQILYRMKRKARNGGIYLFHLGNRLRRKRPQVYYILPKLIKYLKKKGYSLVTLKQIVNSKQD